jgi:large subunit ribosomal protein L15
MTELHNLRPAEGSHRNRKRKGRGPGSGNGKNAGRGENGQKSRSGGLVRPGFEGGQMPLHRRIPKRGFTPLKRKVYQVVNLGDLSCVGGTTVTIQTLKEAGLVRSTRGLVKILGQGDITEAYTVEVHAFSGSARDKITAAGGSATVIAMSAKRDVDAPEAAVEDAAAPANDEEE